MKLSTFLKAATFSCGIVISAFFLTGCSDNVEETAKELTTQLEQENGGFRTCKKVELGDKIGDNKWAANATMSDGNIVPIIVERKGDMVEVTAPIAE